MSKNNPSGDKGSFLGSIRRPLDKVKRWARSSSGRPSGQSVSNVEDQHLRPTSAAGVTSDSANDTPHLLVPSTLGTHPWAVSAPDLASGASPPTHPAGGQASQGDEKTNIDEERATEWGPAWLGLKTALGELHQTAKLFPALHDVIGSFLSCFELFQAAAKHRQDYNQLASDLDALVVFLDQPLRESGSTALSDSVSNIVMSLKIKLRKATAKSKQNVATGAMRVREDEDALIESYQRISNLFRYLQIDANLSTWSITNEHLAKTRLGDTQPAKLASHDAALPAEIARRTCTESTRTAILSGLDEWSCDPSKAKVYWMNGMAGTGKMTIACSLCEVLTKRKQLGASFFCTHTLPECRDARRIIPTIAYQLAQYSRPFKSALCKVLENDPDIRTRKIQVQFERLLKEPLIEIKDTIPNNVVVVVDALDECTEADQVQQILSQIFRFASDLPLKFFVTSRPDPGISDSIVFQRNEARDILYLHEIEKLLAQADIELYLKEELSSVAPADSDITRLAELAGCLFIYATTAIRYIRPTVTTRLVNSQERLRDIIRNASGSTQQHGELDTLYRTVLEAALNKDVLESREVARGLAVLWTAVSTREPVSVECLAWLAGIDTVNTQTVLQSFQSVLHVSQASGLVSTLHASFPDFINSQARLKWLFRNPDHVHFMARQCFALMKTGLRFNICELESSFVLDETIQNLDQRVAKHIPQPLSYTCRYWGDHLSLASSLDGLSAMLEDFLTSQLLFWMEVLNLTRSKTLGIVVLYVAQQWLVVKGPSPYLSRLISDSKQFVVSFTTNPTASSTPHLYLSALPFCYKSSLVYTLYLPRMNGLTRIEGTVLKHGVGSDARWSTGVRINAVAPSPISNIVAFGGCDNDNQGMIGVLDYHTGAYILPAFKGHSKPINSLAFSFDGNYIASASDNQTVCVWNASNPKLAYKPLRGHTGGVSSVIFSQDSALIISGSYDTTVRVWATQDGLAFISPFEGHTDAVTCVALSPDGTRIVSGSRDLNIRVWSIPDQSCIPGPFQVHHVYWVRSVAFSSDGLHVAVGFNSGISMWDLQNGKQLPGFGQGHSDSTVSVAFSPNFASVISSSDSSSKICIWDAKTGKPVSQVDAHTGYVNCITFSLDGAYILSGSNDTTICIWLAHSLNSSTDTPQGVPSSVGCIAFSANGSRFASGSNDGSVCVWAVKDGRLIVGPLKGHGAPVMAVAYSPDQLHIVSAASNGSLFTWSAQNGSVVSGPVQGPVPEDVRSMAISSDITRVVSGFDSGAICVWGVEDGKIIIDSFKGHTQRVYLLAFLPDGTHIVSGSWDSTVCVWNAHDGTRISDPFTAHASDMNCVSFSPDGSRIASGSDDGTICVHNAEDGKLVAGPFEGHSRWVMLVAFSPDGTQIVSGSTSGEVHVWDANTDKQVAGPFTGAHSSTRCSAFSPDSHHIVCCHDNCSIRCIQLSPPLTSAPVPVLDGELRVDDSGWLVNQQGQHLLWVPPHICPFFPSLHDSLVITSDGTIQVKYSNILVGSTWAKCYVG